MPGIVDADRTVFLVPWHKLPSPAFERQFLLHWWKSRGSWSPDELGSRTGCDGRWSADRRPGRHGRAIRCPQDRYPGSWLGAANQGRGLTEMRAAVLALAFDGLGAETAESGYITGNAASARVSEKLGYVPNGEDVYARRLGDASWKPSSRDTRDVAARARAGHDRGPGAVPDAIRRGRAGPGRLGAPVAGCAARSATGRNAASPRARRLRPDHVRSASELRPLGGGCRRACARGRETSRAVGLGVRRPSRRSAALRAIPVGGARRREPRPLAKHSGLLAALCEATVVVAQRASGAVRRASAVRGRLRGD